MGWVVEDQDARIVGYLGNIPLAYSYEGQRLLAASAHTWVVDAAARTASLLLLRAFLGQKDVDLLLCTTAKPVTSRIFDAAKVPRLPVAGYDISLYWITYHAGLGASLLRQKGWPGVALAEAVLPPVGALLDRMLRTQPAWRYDSSELSFLDSFDEGFDVFWERLCAGRRHLLGVRDRATLAWHFHESLAQGRAWVVAHRIQGVLNAYAIFLRQDNPEYRLTRMRLVDYQSLSGETDSLAAFIGAALRRCQAERLHLLEVVGFTDSIRQQLVAWGARQRVLPSWMFYYKAPRLELARALARSDAWYPSFYDGDGSLL